MSIDPSRHHGVRECPSCACEVAANENRCPICGYEFPSGMTGRSTFRFAAGVILLALFLAMVFGLLR